MKNILSKSRSIITISAISISAMVSAGSPGHAEDKSTSSLVVSATRYEMPQSRVSNDITVITKEEISHLPVHDVSEALGYITGLALDRNGGPGTLTVPSIQGSDPRHVKVLIDDVPLDLLMDQAFDLSMIPIENVERIEVLKGAASSVWGSSLGGVINIVTRKPSDEVSGDAGVSIGEGNTRKYNAAVSGKGAGTGYFLSAARFETDGFFRNQDTDTEVNSFFGKLTRDLTKGLKMEVSYGSNSNKRRLEFTDFGFSWDNKNSDSYGRVGIAYAPTADLDFTLSAFVRQFNYKQEMTNIGDITPFFTQDDREDSYGGTLKSVWRHSNKGTVSAGIDASNWTLDDSTQTQKYYTDKRAIYINENYGIGNLTLAAGLRYDDDTVFGSETSPSAGLVYNIEKASTLLRLNVARGFTPPPLGNRYAGTDPNKDLTAERAWTYQAGFETRYIPGLWGKVTLYRADITDAMNGIYDTSFNFVRWENIKNFRRQGIEVEARTAEYKGISLSYGYAFNDVRDLDKDEIVKNKARETHDVGIDYRGPFETRTTLKGHHVNWNAKDVQNAKDNTFIWDAKFSKYLAHWKRGVGELFVSVHNITDDKQFMDEIFPNPGRWVEAGVGLTF